MLSETIIRQAREEDAGYVAKTVLTALDMDTSDLEHARMSCADPRSMYSWNKSLIAESEGRPIGCIISYPGNDYLNLRQFTWPKLWRNVDEDDIKNCAIEAYPGEYYLDSMTIEPEFRGNGLGKDLIMEAIAHGKTLGFDRFALLVAVEKPRLMAYYSSLGFEEESEVNFFGHRFKRMVCQTA